MFKNSLQLADSMNQKKSGKADFERYANLKDYYDVLDDEGVNVVLDKYGNDVGYYYPESDEFEPDEFYDEVEPHSDTQDIYRKRMTALGYTPDQIESVIRDYYR